MGSMAPAGPAAEEPLLPNGSLDADLECSDDADASIDLNGTDADLELGGPPFHCCCRPLRCVLQAVGWPLHREGLSRWRDQRDLSNHPDTPHDVTEMLKSCVTALQRHINSLSALAASQLQRRR